LCSNEYTVARGKENPTLVVICNADPLGFRDKILTWSKTDSLDAVAKEHLPYSDVAYQILAARGSLIVAKGLDSPQEDQRLVSRVYRRVVNPRMLRAADLGSEAKQSRL
jgi:hypothetical protein